MRGRALLLVAAMVLGALGMSASPAQAGNCWAETYWTSTAPPNSTSFSIRHDSVCNDLQAAYVYSSSDYVKGWYLSGGTWRSGSAGWQWVTTEDDGWDVLLTNVVNGTTVRGETWSVSQSVRYVH